MDINKAVYYQTFEDKHNGHFIQRTFLKNNTLVKLEPLIIDNGKKSLDGKLMFYYPCGKLHYSREFTGDVLNGEVIGYFENGMVRRLEHYRNGRMTDGKCYGAMGQDTTFYEYEKQATFKNKDIIRFRDFVIPVIFMLQ